MHAHTSNMYQCSEADSVHTGAANGEDGASKSREPSLDIAMRRVY